MFENARGRNQAALIDDPLVRRGVEQWLERVLGFYGEDGGVDVEVIANQVILNEKSRAHLYSDYTPLELKYVSGSRPMLEAVVREVTTPAMNAREKARALMRRVRDNQDRGLKKWDLFFGGHEEDLLRRGARMCNEVSRLYACLCQIAGLPARLFCAHISGHMMNEVYIDGKWRWIDSMKGFMPVNDKDELVSAWDLWKDPRLFERQPKSVWDDVRPPAIMFGTQQRDPRNLAKTMAHNRDCYFHPREALAIGNYFVWDHAKYTYPWRIEPADLDRLQRARHAEQLNRAKLGWPSHYYDPNLLDETVKMRS
ncbi:MAG: transglutaminase domain-containing protein [Planctomycetes bacterium]|nr:transglutaminase domain-containing protein [Planctomycetota bacterium]